MQTLITLPLRAVLEELCFNRHLFTSLLLTATAWLDVWSWNTCIPPNMIPVTS